MVNLQLSFLQSHRHSLRGSWTSEAVVWMSDDKTNECCYCQQKFNAFRRKHHCRFVHGCLREKSTYSSSTGSK